MASVAVCPRPVLLPVTMAQALAYRRLFVNRQAYVRQTHSPNKENGRYFYYKKVNKVTNELESLTKEVVQDHLRGKITVGLYAIEPRNQTSKWVAIDADYADSRHDLLRLQQAFANDGITALLERSRRGGHLWVFFAKPLPARLCRLYVLNIAFRLGVPIKRDKEEGIEVFPRQDEIAADEYGNAIRGPMGIHRASGIRYWFEDAPPILQAQFDLLRNVPKVTEAQLLTLTAAMPPIPEPATAKPWVDFSKTAGSDGKTGFQIMDHIKTRLHKSGKNYVTACPCCDAGGSGRHLSISVREPTKYRCWHGCTAEQIRDALGTPKRKWDSGQKAA